MSRASKEQLAALAGLLELEADFLEACLQCGAVAGEELFADSAQLPAAVPMRLRRIHRLCRSLELDVFAGSIVVDLMDRIDEMERDMERLRARLP